MIQPGSSVKNALLLNEEEHINAKPIYAVTLVLTQINGQLDAAPLQETEFEDQKFRFDLRQTQILLSIVQQDLSLSKTISELAEALTSQEPL